MKSIIFALFFAAPTALLVAGPKEDVKADLKAKDDSRNAAANLFQTSNPAAAIDQLQATRPVEAIADGRLASTLQGLIETAITLFNRRNPAAARSAAQQALAVGDPVLTGRTTMPADRRGELCRGLGFLAENILHDNQLATSLYALAVQINPTDKLAVKRRDAFAAQEKQQNSRK